MGRLIILFISKTWVVSLILASNAIIENKIRFKLRTTYTVLIPDPCFTVNNRVGSERNAERLAQKPYKGMNNLKLNT